jgi:hypothetical protein
MNFARAIFIGLILLGSSFAQQAPNDIPPAKWTDRTNLGYHGPVHCSMITTQKIAPDPREQRDVTVSTHPGTPWMCFNQDGWIVENGGVENGKLINVVKEQRGPNGERVSSSLNDREVKRREGNVEIEESWNNDRLAVRRKTWLDSQDRPIRTEMQLGNNGYVVSTTTYDGSAETTDTQEFSGGKLTRHHRTTIDDQTGLIDKMRFDLDGSMIAEIRSVKDHLTYAWHVPGIKDMDNPVGTIWGEPYNDSVSFYFARNGDVLKEVQHHPDRRDNGEPDDVEVTDSRGVVVERVEFKYERDAHGNWINRTVLVRNPKTGAMIEVARNQRELTYY